MTNESSLALRQPNQAAEFNDEQVEILRKTLFKNFSDDEIKFSLAVCNRTGLDPFVRQIYFQKRKSTKGEETIVITTGIDGFRLTANRSNAYAGSDEPIFEENDGKPIKATVTVYKIVQGQRVGFTAAARWAEFYPGDPQGAMWRKMPFGQLGKCAEAQALRKAFPAELSNIYSHEEMAQASNDRQLVQTKADQVNQLLDIGPDLEIEATVEPEEPDFVTQAAAKPKTDVGDYIIPIGKKYLGKRLKDIEPSTLQSFVDWVKDNFSNPNAMTIEFVETAEAYLSGDK